MDIKLLQAIRDFEEATDDTTDCYIAYLQEKDMEKKEILSLVYEKLKKRRSEAIKRMNEQIKEIYGR